MKHFLIVFGLIAIWSSTVATTNTVKMKETYWTYQIESAQETWQDTTGVLRINVPLGKTLWFMMEGDSERDSIIVLPSVAAPSKDEPQPKDWIQPASFVLRPGSTIFLKATSPWGWARLIILKSSPTAKTIKMSWRTTNRWWFGK